MPGKTELRTLLKMRQYWSKPNLLSKAIWRTHFPHTRQLSSARVFCKTLEDGTDVDEFLAKPTWSVRSLLPTEKHIAETTDVTAKQLHHLLRLCALPPPSTLGEEAKMLKDLKAQLHFVKEIQKVDTENVEPMKSVVNESALARDTDVISLETLKDALNQEEVVGKHYKRTRRRSDVEQNSRDVEDWDVLEQAPNKVGRYFVVKSEKS